MKNLPVPDAADHLDNDRGITEYLDATLEDGDPKVFLRAMAGVSKAHVMSKSAFSASSILLESVQNCHFQP